MAQPHRVKGALLDFDGTLVRLGTDYPLLRRYVSDALAGVGIRPPQGSLLDGLERLRRSASSPIERRGVRNAYEAIDRAEWEGRMRARVCRDGRALCESLTQRGIPWAVVSNNGRQLIEWCLRRYNFSWPSVVVARGEAARHKPHPAMGRIAFAKLKLSRKQAVLLGDSEVDLKFGHALKVETVILPPGGDSRAKAMRRFQRLLGVEADA